MALQLWIVLFIVFFGAEVIHLEPALRLITQVLYGVPLAAWALWRLRGPTDRLDWAVLGLLAVFAVVCVLSRDRTESLGALALATANAAWFLMMRRAGDLRTTIILAAATGLALTLAFNAVLLVMEKLEWYAVVGAARLEGHRTFPWESVNALPVLVLVAIPFVAWLERGWLRAILALVVGVSAIVVVPISLGRAGWLGLTVAAVVAAVTSTSARRLLARTSSWARIAGLAGGAVVVAGALALVGPRLVRAIGESGRLLLWEQGLNMVRANPIAGSGPGTYSWARLEFPPASADPLAVRLLHDAPLQTLVDGGVILGAAVLAVLVMWGLAAAARAGTWRWNERIAVACAIGFLAALTLDDFSYLPAVIAAALAIGAFLVPVAAPNRSGFLLPAVLALAAIMAVPNVIAVDTARADAQDARSAMIAGDYAAAAAGFEAAAGAHPESGGYWLGLGMASAYGGDQAGAREAYERATSAAPGDPRGYGGLAAVDPGTDELELLRYAADHTLGDPQYAVRLGLTLAGARLVDDATRAWGRAVALLPELLRLLPYAETGISMEAVADEAVLTIQREPRPAPAENLVKLWDIGLGLDDLPPDAGAAWRAVDAARHGDAGRGAADADAAVAEAPWDPRGWEAVAAVAAFACDAAEEDRALATIRKFGNEFIAADPGPQVQREFVYREASLGHTQPPGVGSGIELEQWPWSLVDRPPECDS